MKIESKIVLGIACTLTTDLITNGEIIISNRAYLKHNDVVIKEFDSEEYFYNTWLKNLFGLKTIIRWQTNNEYQSQSIIIGETLDKISYQDKQPVNYIIAYDSDRNRILANIKASFINKLNIEDIQLFHWLDIKEEE